jgi:CubicO group peptidase (beta-lactamase class C family)
MVSRRMWLQSLVASIPFAASLFGPLKSAQVKPAAGLLGRWGGQLVAGSATLRLVLVVQDGKLPILYSVDQGNQPIPADAGTVGEKALDVTFSAINGRLVLKLSDKGVLEGTWSQGGALALTLTRLAEGAVPEKSGLKDLGDLSTEVTAGQIKYQIPALVGGFQVLRGKAQEGREVVAGTLTVTDQTRVREGQLWHVGSITKSMTATLVARLVERGLLSWEMKLGDAFGTLAPNMLPAYRDRTLANLMTGQTGMPTNLLAFDMMAQSGANSPREGRTTWVAKAFALSPQSGMVYPNNGYVLAGALCEAVTGKAYEDLMVEEVFKPLKLDTAGFGPPGEGNPQGHRKALLGGRLMAVRFGAGADNPASMAPAGGVHISIPDLLAFGLAHSLGHQGQRTDYLKTETWRALHTPPPAANYAFGWVEREDGSLWHNGSNTYWLAELSFDPEKPVAIAAAANRFDAGGALGRVMGAASAEAMTRLAKP